jgi:FolB domain-containing protein
MSHADWIRLRGLKVDCVVGVYANERNTPQPLVIDVDMCLDTDPAGASERLRSTIDYASVAMQIGFLLTSSRFRMLETAAHVLCRYLLAPPALGEQRPQIERVRVVIEKPHALSGHAVPSVEMSRSFSDMPALVQEQKPFGTVDIAIETQDAGIYRLNVAPGRGIPLHVHREMRESEMVLSEGLLCNGVPAKVGLVHRWPLNSPHRYDNPTTKYQTILCVDSPRFMEADEIPVEGEPIHVPPEAIFSPWGGP